MRKRLCLAFVFLSITSFADATPLRIMPLGDSNTRGAYPTDFAGPNPASIGAGGYRYFLQQKLKGEGRQFDFVGSQTSNAVGDSGLGQNPPNTWYYDPTFDADHEGLAGFSNDAIIAGGPVPTLPGDPIHNAPSLVNSLSIYQPDVILLMSGTNGIDPANVNANIQSLDHVIRLITHNSPNTKLIISTIFDRWDSAAYHTAVQTYNAGIPALVTAAQQRGEHVSFVDCGGVLVQSDFYGDGVHALPPALSKVADVWDQGILAVVPVPEPGTATITCIGSTLLYSGMRLHRHRFRLRR